jgi:LPS-assembly protein
MALPTQSLMTRRRAMPGLAASGGPRFRPWRAALLASLIACCFGFGTVGTAFAQAGQTLGQKRYTNDLGKILKPPRMDKSEPMLLQADEMVYDDVNNRVTARGNVEIYYGNYVLLADQVIYDRNANTLAAQGNVRIKDPEGAIITSNQMTLTDDFRDGFINALRVVTKDDTRIVAQSATREAGNVTVFQKGWFTPCKPCESDPDRPPTWRIRAQKIIHRKDEATLTYRNMFFDFFGVPVLWAPYFQSADPTVKRKSGFLMPQYSQGARLGTTVTVPYYFALADNYDLTFVPMYTSKEGTLLQGSWRQQLANGGYRVDLHGVFDDGTFAMPAGEDFRGSISTQGRFSLNPYWSWGWDGTAQTDRTFNRFYGITPNFEGSAPSFADAEIQTEEVSQIYLEGLKDRNYFSMRFYETRDLNTPIPPDSNATVYPIVDYDYIVKQPIIGGELSFNSNAMALTNDSGTVDGASTNSDRAIVQMNWRRQMIDGIGEVFTPFAQLRGDIYEVNNFIDPTNSLSENGSILRGNAVAGAEYRYPFIGTTGSVAHIFEPIAQIIARPSSVGNQNLIPNEDAESLIFDDTILFDIDKFSGYDRIETGTRANVGGRYTMQFASGVAARAVFGESYQIAGQNSFDLPGFENSGLTTTSSDYVTGFYLEGMRYLSLAAQARFNVDTFALERADLWSTVNAGPILLSVNYADGIIPTTTTVTPVGVVELAPTGVVGLAPTTSSGLVAIGPLQRSQEILSRGALALTDAWALLGDVRYDLQLDQLISGGGGVRWQNDCMSISVTYEASNIEELDVRPDQRVMVFLSLKDLGNFGYQTSATGL